jgi:hypothetical protein
MGIHSGRRPYFLYVVIWFFYFLGLALKTQCRASGRYYHLISFRDSALAKTL